MRSEIQHYLEERSDLKYFVRSNPSWYRKLSRNPASIQSIESEAKFFYGKTFPQKVEQFEQKLSMASMMLEMVKMMGQQQENSEQGASS